MALTRAGDRQGLCDMNPHTAGRVERKGGPGDFLAPGEGQSGGFSSNLVGRDPEGRTLPHLSPPSAPEFWH